MPALRRPRRPGFALPPIPAARWLSWAFLPWEQMIKEGEKHECILLQEERAKRKAIGRAAAADCGSQDPNPSLAAADDLQTQGRCEPPCRPESRQRHSMFPKCVGVHGDATISRVVAAHLVGDARRNRRWPADERRPPWTVVPLRPSEGSLAWSSGPGKGLAAASPKARKPAAGRQRARSSSPLFWWTVHWPGRRRLWRRRLP